MPLTPFHVGPGLLFAAAMRERFSLGVFVATQVAIDLEVLLALLAGSSRLHGTFHTLPGAVVVSLGVALLVRPLLNRLPARIALRRSPVTVGTAALSGLLGALCQVVPDAIMHADAKPLAPWSPANPLLHAASLPSLHAVLLASGVLGAVIWLAQRALDEPAMRPR